MSTLKRTCSDSDGWNWCSPEDDTVPQLKKKKLSRRQRKAKNKRVIMFDKLNGDNGFHQVVKNDYNCAVYAVNNLAGYEVVTHDDFAEIAKRMHRRQFKNENYGKSILFKPKKGKHTLYIC